MKERRGGDRVSLVASLSRVVDPSVRERGFEYYLGGAIRIYTSSRDVVEALVTGSRAYDVALRRQGKTLLVSCTCPYFQSELEPCKHVWATLLAAEDRGCLARPGKGSIEGIEVDPEALLYGWEEYENEDVDENEEEGEHEGEGEDEDESVEWETGRRRPVPLAKARSAVIASARKAPTASSLAASSRKAPATAAIRKEPTTAPVTTSAPKAPRPKSAVHWKRIASAVRDGAQLPETSSTTTAPLEGEIFYEVNVPVSLDERALVLDVVIRNRRVTGSWCKSRPLVMTLGQVPLLRDPADRRIITLLSGARAPRTMWTGYNDRDYQPVLHQHRLPAAVAEMLVPMLCATGRCRLKRDPADTDPPVLAWDEGPAWQLWLVVRRAASGPNYLLSGSLRRAEEQMDLATPVLLIAGGLVFNQKLAARLEDFGAFGWILYLRRLGHLTVPTTEKDELLAEILRLRHRPLLDLPQELGVEDVKGEAVPVLHVKRGEDRAWGPERLRADLSFEYEGQLVARDSIDGSILQLDRRRAIRRDAESEHRAFERLRELGFHLQTEWRSKEVRLTLHPRRLPGVVRTLLDEGWRVEAEGQVYRKPGGMSTSVTSGIDWFDLDGRVEFGDQVAHLPQLLAALKRNEGMVLLGDGSYGLLPEEWLRRYAPIAGMGEVSGDQLRFKRTQVGLLDALLAAEPEISVDAIFTRAREELGTFRGIRAEDAPTGFVGALRGYQREGLGWLGFLERFGFGGCLADDMGLGKTVQVLALLESRRRTAGRKGEKPKEGKPSLVVAPRSLVFNWKQEAARFTPKLRLLDHTGTGREGLIERFADFDMVLTTYGTLRRDAARLKDASFDYVILDEAQVIKNAKTQAAKAARLLRSDHRLALSGTPVENHLGELWALFDFLNPGMLGAASVFRAAGTFGNIGDEEKRALLARALRPFILRRTKEQVATELPSKVEQTLHCELETAQRRLYDELREHYRRSLAARIGKGGLGRAKIQVLEALLRLRQAACHPGLIDRSRASEPSAKLDVLLPHLAEILDEGHKALVFSQFTSLLAIVRDRLDEQGIEYGYLDGSTRDRATVVERFQNDPACRLFLISLKAGGLGLNLTAAEYVFLLDPWWNPAVEAQAIDRSHRIGQTRRVFAYRLVARDTVEEKILDLQKTKRDLADAIIQADGSLIQTLTREDLEVLLS